MAVVSRTCANKKCGKVFEARSADVARGWAKFCCKSCKATVQETKTGANRQFQARVERREVAYERGFHEEMDAAGHMHDSGYFGHGQH